MTSMLYVMWSIYDITNCFVISFFLIIIKFGIVSFRLTIMRERDVKIILETKIDIKFSLLQITQIHVYR